MSSSPLFEQALDELERLQKLLEDHHLPSQIAADLQLEIDQRTKRRKDAAAVSSRTPERTRRAAAPEAPRTHPTRPVSPKPQSEEAFFAQREPQPPVHNEQAVEHKRAAFQPRAEFSKPSDSQTQSETAASRSDEPVESPVKRGKPSVSSPSASPKNPLAYADLLGIAFPSNEETYFVRSQKGFFYQPCPIRLRPGCPYFQKNAKPECKTCTVRPAISLGRREVLNHLHGQSEIGLSPLSQDGHIAYACITIESGQGQKAALEVQRAAKAIGLDVLCEERKEDGVLSWRIWFLLAMPVDASRVSRFLRAFLINGFAKGELRDLRFLDQTFPRIFVKEQPKDRGMALPLPLFGWLDEALRKQGRDADRYSILIDEKGEEIADPFAQIQSITRVEPAQMEAQIRECTSRKREELFAGDPKSEPDTMESMRLIAADDDPFVFAPLQESGVIEVIEKGRIWVCADALPASVQNQILAMGSYWNPAYRSQKNKFATGPRIVSLARREAHGPQSGPQNADSENTENKNNTGLGTRWISLPRHLKAPLLYRLSQAGATVDLQDWESEGQSVPMEFNGELRPEQVSLASALYQKGSGILEAATGTGKTVIGAALIAQISRSTLILVNSKEILQGWVSSLNRFLHFSSPEWENWKAPSKNYPGKIGVLQGATRSLSGRVDVAMVPSLVQKENLEELLSGYGVVFVDECHHAGSPSYQKVLDALQAKRVYGLSATPKRTDGLSTSMFWQLGEIAASFSSKDQMASQTFHRVICPRFTPFAGSDAENNDFTRLVQEAASHPLRNEMIVQDIREALDNGRTVLVLTRFIEHAHTLARLLAPGDDTELFVYAGDPKRKQENTRRLRELEDPKVRKDKKVVLIGTYASISEGFDFPLLDTLMLALPIRSQITISQSIGRIHRQTRNKQIAIVYDYADVQNRMLESMYQARLKEYVNQGYQIGEVLDERKGTSSGKVYRTEDYISACVRDIRQAKKRVALCTRAFEDEQLQTLIDAAGQKALEGVRFDLFVENASDEQVRRMRNAGFHVHFHARIVACCLIEDQEIVWYGNVFSSQAASSGIVRMVSRKDANELLEARRREEIRQLSLQHAQASQS